MVDGVAESERIKSDTLANRIGYSRGMISIDDILELLLKHGLTSH